MAWYDLFARFYDASLEKLYAEHRGLAARALSLEPGSCVIDLPCGTGQSFPYLQQGLGPDGRVIGIDLSEGMLVQARERIAREGGPRVNVLQADAARLELADLDAATGEAVRPDRLHIFLGMSVFPAHDAIFNHLWSLLAPGGRCVIVDVYAERPGLHGRLVNWMARADISRRFWEPLEAVGEGVGRYPLPYRAAHGGQIWLATARKPVSGRPAPDEG